jgi:hypothetical protein
MVRQEFHKSNVTQKPRRRRTITVTVMTQIDEANPDEYEVVIMVMMW